MGSAGFLYRQIVANTSVLGAYVFGDYNQANSGHQYWVIAPGIESLGRTWDFHLNGYIPIGTKYWENEAWAQEFGDYSYIEFQEGTNNVYDHRLAYYEETGIGGDAEVGCKLFKARNTLVKGYLQGYYYSMDHNSDITGGGAKITIQPSRYLTFSINDTYDNYQHNVFMLGAQIRLNDLFNKSNKPIDENNLTDRLLDPVDRNFASTGAGTSAPATHGNETYDLGQSLYTANGVFFDDNGSGYHSPNEDQYPKGTYGNPYTEEDDIYNNPNGMQGVFDMIRGDFVGNVYMYFAPGNYYTSTSSGNDQGMSGNPVQLADGMNILGRNYWYTTPTYGNDRALFLGSLQLIGDNYLDSMRVENVPKPPALTYGLDGMFTEGILIDGASNVALNNVQVGTLDPVNNYENYVTGVSITNGSYVTINNSQLYGYSDEVNGAYTISAAGIMVDNSNLIIGSNNTIKAIAVYDAGYYSTLDIFAVGVDSADSNITIGNNNTISGEVNIINNVYGDESLGGNVDVNSMALGIYFVVDVSDVTNTLNIGDGNSIEAKTTGFTIFDYIAGAEVQSSASAYGLTYINEAGSNSNIIISMGNNNTIDALATGGTIYGTIGTGTEEITTEAVGIFASSGVSTLNINGDNNKIYADVTTGTFADDVIADSLSVSGYAIGYETNELFGQGVAESTLNINGSYNEFNANGSEEGFGLVTSPSSLNIELNAFGIFSGPNTSGVNINIGNYNSIIATTNESYAPNTSGIFTAIGISAYDTSGEENNVVIGNYNTIETTSHTDTPVTNTTKNVIGIYDGVGNNVILGSYNKIFVASGSDFAVNNLFIGIFNQGVFTFQGGYNEINVSGGEVGQATGITNDDGEVHFNTGAGSGYNVLNISMSGTGASSQVFGILGSNNAKFFEDNTEISNATDLYNFLVNDYYTTLNHTGGDPSSSYIIDWSSHGTCSWWNPVVCV